MQQNQSFNQVFSLRVIPYLANAKKQSFNQVLSLRVYLANATKPTIKLNAQFKSAIWLMQQNQSFNQVLSLRVISSKCNKTNHSIKCSV